MYTTRSWDLGSNLEKVSQFSLNENLNELPLVIGIQFITIYSGLLAYQTTPNTLILPPYSSTKCVFDEKGIKNKNKILQ